MHTGNGYDPDKREAFCERCIHARKLRDGFTRCAHSLCTVATVPLINGWERGNSARERMDVRPIDNLLWASQKDAIRRKSEILKVHAKSGILENWRWPWRYLDTLMESCGCREYQEERR